MDNQVQPGGLSKPKIIMESKTTKSSSSNDNASKDDSNKGISSADMTRRMICGGLAGMVAKVRIVQTSTRLYSIMRHAFSVVLST
jgi:hypothetical protein